MGIQYNLCPEIVKIKIPTYALEVLLCTHAVLLII